MRCCSSASDKSQGSSLLCSLSSRVPAKTLLSWDTRAASFLLLPQQLLQCVHCQTTWPLQVRLFLAGIPRGAQRGHPRAAVLTAFVLIGLSCCNAARNRPWCTCRDNEVGSFHLTRSEFFKFKVFILLSQTWFLPIIFSQVSQYCYTPSGQAKNPVPQTDGANEGEIIINANKIL